MTMVSMVVNSYTMAYLEFTERGLAHPLLKSKCGSLLVSDHEHGFRI